MFYESVDFENVQHLINIRIIEFNTNNTCILQSLASIFIKRNFSHYNSDKKRKLIV